MFVIGVDCTIAGAKVTVASVTPRLEVIKYILIIVLYNASAHDNIVVCNYSIIGGLLSRCEDRGRDAH